MAAGHIVAGQCVDVAQSTDIFFSHLQPSITAGNPSYNAQATKVAGSWYLQTYQSGTLISQTALTAPDFPTCDTTQTFFDGMQLGWAVAAAMVIVYVIRRPYR